MTFHFAELAKLLTRLGRHRDALPVYNTAVTQDPTNPDTLLERALLHTGIH